MNYEDVVKTKLIELYLNKEVKLTSIYDKTYTGTITEITVDYISIKTSISGTIDLLLTEVSTIEIIKKTKYCTQCTAENGQIGCFLYEGVYPSNYKRTSGIFPSLLELYYYCRDNNIDHYFVSPLL